MINTISKTLEAQEKTQDIKQSPRMKMGTKPDARSQRNELGRCDRMRPYEDQTRPISCSAIAGVSSSDQTLDRTLAVDRPDAGQQSPIEYREVPER